MNLIQEKSFFQTNKLASFLTYNRMHTNTWNFISVFTLSCSKELLFDLEYKSKVSLSVLSYLWWSSQQLCCCESRCEIGWFRVLFDQFRLSRLILKFFFFLQISSSTWDIFSIITILHFLLLLVKIITNTIFGSQMPIKYIYGLLFNSSDFVWRFWSPKNTSCRSFFFLPVR